MKIKTTRFGEIEIAEEDVIEFPEGLLGFEYAKHFVIISNSDSGPFRWLQSLDEPDLAFVIIEPLQFLFSYELEIPDPDLEFLQIKSQEDVILFVIVTIPEDPKQMTANLQGPLVINHKIRKGRQIISNNPQHSVKTSIIKAMEERAKKIQELQNQQSAINNNHDQNHNKSKRKRSKKSPEKEGQS